MQLGKDIPPQWLETLRNDLLEITLPAAAVFWPIPGHPGRAFFNYRVEHVKQVERESLLLHGRVGGDLDIILASVWLHDRFQPAFDGPDHGHKADHWAQAHLAELGFPSEKVERVCFAVANHSSKSGVIPRERHEARLLWDADKLSHVAPVEMLMLLMNNLAADALGKLAANPSPEDRQITMASLVKMMQGGWGAGRTYYFSESSERAEQLLSGARHFSECLMQQVGTNSF